MLKHERKMLFSVFDTETESLQLQLCNWRHRSIGNRNKKNSPVSILKIFSPSLFFLNWVELKSRQNNNPKSQHTRFSVIIHLTKGMSRYIDRDHKIVIQWNQISNRCLYQCGITYQPCADQTPGYVEWSLVT